MKNIETPVGFEGSQGNSDSLTIFRMVVGNAGELVLLWLVRQVDKFCIFCPGIIHEVNFHMLPFSFLGLLAG